MHEQSQVCLFWGFAAKAHLVLHIHQINQANSRNGCAVQKFCGQVNQKS